VEGYSQECAVVLFYFQKQYKNSNQKNFHFCWMKILIGRRKVEIIYKISFFGSNISKTMGKEVFICNSLHTSSFNSVHS
jgi:hypothetical protein